MRRLGFSLVPTRVRGFVFRALAVVAWMSISQEGSAVMLEWMGKSKVINHHNEVPFRVLERQYSFDRDGKHEPDVGSENMIVHGDNLLGLKTIVA